MRSCSDLRRGAVALGLALGLVAAPVRAAAPTDREAVVLLPLVVDGELADTARTELALAAKSGLARGGVVLREATEPCAEATCVAAAAKGARTALRVRIGVVERNYTIAIELLEGTNGAITASKQASCELCGTAEVATVLADQLAAMAARLVPDEPPPPRLTAASEPSGARVRLGPRELGRTPLATEIPAGHHELVFDKPGYQSVTRPIDAVAGVVENVQVVLPRAKRPLRAAGGALLGGGALVLGGGAVALAIDNHPYRRRCSGDDVDFAGRCRFRHVTAAIGIALTSIGGALMIAGIAMLTARVRSRR